MSEVLLDYFKAFYPYFAIPALAGIGLLIKNKAWKKEYSVLLAIYAASYLLMIVQVYTADQTLDISRRYLLPYTPILFGFAAVLWQWLEKRFANNKIIGTVLIILIGIFLLLDALNPTLKDYISSKRIQRNKEIRQMAAILNKQLAGVPRQPAKALWFYEPRIPGKAVLKDAPPSLAYLSSCEIHNPYFPHEKFSYLVRTAWDDPNFDPRKFTELYHGKYYQLLQVKTSENNQ
ncbi:MAG: hypothetical protein E7052_05150 [Lentisphaerae bacterium]|nr:hypothetical protein [Lentisphaerota bacterium]